MELLMYWVYYSPLKPPLLLSEEEMKTYTKMMIAVNKGTPYTLRAFSWPMSKNYPTTLR